MNKIPPAKHFERGDRVYVQAQQVWLILVAFVMDRHEQRNPRKPKTITYGDLARLMGYPDRRAGHVLARQLGIVGHFCRMNDLPALNAIVVTHETKIPGAEVLVREGRNYRQEQADVMRTNWFGIRVPTTGTFRKIWEAMQ